MIIKIQDLFIEQKHIEIDLDENVICITSIYENDVRMVCEVNIQDLKKAIKFLEDNGNI